MKCFKSSMMFAAAAVLSLSLTSMAQAVEYAWVLNLDTLAYEGGAYYSGQAAIAAPGDYWNVFTDAVLYDSEENATTATSSIAPYAGIGHWGDLGGVNNNLNNHGAFEFVDPVVLTMQLGSGATAESRYDVAAYIGIPGYSQDTYTFTAGTGEIETATTVLGKGGATLLEGENYVLFSDLAPEYSESLGYYLTISATISNSSAYHISGYQVALRTVPEPGTLALLACGLIGLLCYAWRKRK